MPDARKFNQGDTVRVNSGWDGWRMRDVRNCSETFVVVSSSGDDRWLKLDPDPPGNTTWNSAAFILAKPGAESLRQKWAELIEDDTLGAVEIIKQFDAFINPKPKNAAELLDLHRVGNDPPFCQHCGPLGFSVRPGEHQANVLYQAGHLTGKS